MSLTKSKIFLLCIPFIFWVLTPTNGYSQVYSQSKLTLSNNGNLLCTAIYTTHDSGFVMSGDQGNPVSGAFYTTLIRFDKNAQILWCKKYADTSNWESVHSIYETSGREFLIAGELANTFSAIVHKTDSSGNLLWRSRIYTAFSNTYVSKAIELNGYHYISGNTFSQQLGISVFFLLKTDASGNLLWKKTYPHSDSVQVNNFDLITTQDGNLLLAGFFGGRGYLMKTDTSGNILRLNTYSAYITKVIELASGDYLLLSSSPDLYCTKISQTDGSIIWCKHFYNPLARPRSIPKMATLSNGDIFITQSFGDSIHNGSFIMRLDSMGTRLATYALGNQYSYRYSNITGYSDCKIAAYTYEYATPNNTYSLLALLDTSTNYNLFCNTFPYTISDSLSTLEVDTSTLTIIDPSYLNYSLETIPYITDSIVDSTMCLANSTHSLSTIQGDIIIFPNPCESLCTIYAPFLAQSELRLYDLLGRIIIRQKFNREEQIDLSILKRGIYFVNIYNRSGINANLKLIVD